MTNSWQP